MLICNYSEEQNKIRRREKCFFMRYGVSFVANGRLIVNIEKKELNIEKSRNKK